MDRLTDFFHCVSHEEHLALSFRPRERSPAKEVTKRPVGRPRKRPVDSASTDPQPCTETNRGSQQTEKENVVVEPEKTKAIRHQYTAKQMERVVIL